MSGTRRPLRPTRRQLQVLGWIEEYIERNDRAPTIQEICDGLMVGRGSVQRYLEALEHHKRIRRNRGHRRLEVLNAE